jgi:hypothetical protein
MPAGIRYRVLWGVTQWLSSSTRGQTTDTQSANRFSRTRKESRRVVGSRVFLDVSRRLGWRRQVDYLLVG